MTPVTEKGVYSSAGHVAADATGAVWAVFGDGTLAGSTVLGTSQTGDDDRLAAGVAVGYGSVWVASTFQSKVQRFSPLTLAEIASSTVGSRPSAIAVGFGDIWVTSAGADLVHRIDFGGGSIDATTRVG